jgi:hypothetical protein
MKVGPRLAATVLLDTSQANDPCHTRPTAPESVAGSRPGLTDPGLLVGVNGPAGLGSRRLTWGTTGPMPNQRRTEPMSHQLSHRATQARLATLLIISCCAKNHCDHEAPRTTNVAFA